MVDPYSSQSRTNKLYIAVGSAVLVVALFLGLLGAGVFGFGQRSGGGVTAQKGHVGSPVTGAVAGNPPPVTGIGAESAPSLADPEVVKKMPQHILDWLKHLERCERAKVKLTNDELASAGVLRQLGSLGGVKSGDFVDPEKALDDRVPGKKEEEATKGYSEQWADLKKLFDSVPPPAECIPIRNSYDQHISEVSRYVEKVHDALSKVGTDYENPDEMQKLLGEMRKMLDTNKGDIDAPGKETDKLVQEICDRYTVRKWFSINQDVGPGFGAILGG